MHELVRARSRDRAISDDLGGRGDARAATARRGEEHDALAPVRIGQAASASPSPTPSTTSRPSEVSMMSAAASGAQRVDVARRRRSRPTTSSAASGSRSAERFEDISPIDGRVARRGRARRAQGGRRRGRARRTTRSRPGPRSAPQGRAAVPAPARRSDRRQRRAPGRPSSAWTWRCCCARCAPG